MQNTTESRTDAEPRDETPEGQLSRRPDRDIFRCPQSASGFNIDNMSSGYNDWIAEVNEALSSIKIWMDDWQPRWPFDLADEYKAGTKADDAAMKAESFLVDSAEQVSRTGL